MKLTKLKSKNTLFFTSVLSSALINLTLWIIVWRGFPPSEIPYVIHYSILSGSDIFGTQQNLYIVPFLGLVLLVLNTAIAIFIILYILRVPNNITDFSVYCAYGSA